MKCLLLLLVCIAAACGAPVTQLSDIPSSVYSTDVAKMATVLAVQPSFSAYIEYAELLLASNPSVECAERTIEQEDRSHATTVSIIEDAISSPSTVTEPTYVEELETEYPSIVTAYEQVISLEETNPAFAYIQSVLTTVEVTDPTVLTDATAIMDVASPTTAADEANLYSAVEDSPSIVSYLHLVDELAENYASLSAAEDVIAYYEAVEPSIVSTVQEVVFSPSVAHSPLPAEYPTLASAVSALVSYQKVVSAAAQTMIEEYLVNPATLPQQDVSYVHKLIEDHPTLATEEKIVASYDDVMPSMVVEVAKEVQSPSVLHEPEVVAYPALAHAYSVVDAYKSVLPAAVIAAVSELEESPQVLHGSAASQAKAAAEENTQLEAAYKVIETYKKSIPAVVRKVSMEMSSESVTKAHKEVMQHASLSSAFRVVQHYARSFPALAQAQESVNCAESRHQNLLQNYKHISSVKQSMHQMVHHSAVVKKH